MFDNITVFILFFYCFWSNCTLVSLLKYFFFKNFDQPVVYIDFYVVSNGMHLDHLKILAKKNPIIYCCLISYVLERVCTRTPIPLVFVQTTWQTDRLQLATTGPFSHDKVCPKAWQKIPAVGQLHTSRCLIRVGISLHFRFRSCVHHHCLSPAVHCGLDTV